MIQLVLTSVLLFHFVAAQLNPSQAVPDVKITLTSLQVTDADAISKVTWRAIAPSAIYCVSEHPAANLYFDCPDCDPKIPEEKKFLDELLKAKRLTNAQFPVIAIGDSFARIDVNGRINGKHLRCNATYTGNIGTNQYTRDGMPVKSVSAELDIKYTDTPILIDVNGHEFANGIFVPLNNANQVTVTCTANGNPLPRTGYLMKGTLKVNSLHSSVGKGEQNLVVTCTVFDDFGNPHQSQPYQVKLYVAPTVTNTKYASSDYSLNQQATLECTVKAFPQPTVNWRMITGNIITNATCDQYGNATGQQKVATQNGYSVVTSTCRITMDSYLKVGKYYCDGCLELTKNSPLCSPGMRPGSTANIAISGAPVFTQWTNVTRKNGSTKAKILTQVCANPEPQRGDIYWDISGMKVPEGKKVDNFYALQRFKNVTYPNCYDMTLEIDPLTVSNENENYVLVAINKQSGAKGVQKKLDVRNELIGGDRKKETSTSKSLGLGLGLAFGLFFLLLIICILFCWWRGMACFKKDKDKMAQKPAPRQQAYVHNTVPNVAVHREPEPLPRKTPPPSDTSMNSERMEPNGFRQSREGLTYAELDLVNDGSYRPPPPGTRMPPPRPTNYSAVQPTPAATQNGIRPNSRTSSDV